MTVKNLKLNGQDKHVVGVLVAGGGSVKRNSVITVRDAEIINCGQFGIHVKHADGVYVRDVTLDGNGHYTGDPERHLENHAIYFRDVTDAFVEYVDATGSAANGVNVSNSEDVLLSGLSTRSNGQHGIRIEASDGVRLSDCVASDNGENGVEVHPEEDTYNDDICIERTSSTYNDHYGLYLTYTDTYELSGNTISGNDAGGTVMVAIATPSVAGVCGAIPSDRGVWPFTR